MGIVGGAAALGSAGAGLFGLLGGGAQAPQQFDMPNMGGAANSAYSGIGNLSSYNTYAPNLGQASGIAQNLVNNPYAPQYQQGSNTAAGLGQQGALNAYGTGGNLQQAGSSILNTAFDPQQALYNQQYALTTGQQNAQNAAAGVGTSPYGAGLADQNTQNFNIAWQNAQLGRQATGIQSAGSAYGQGAGLQTGAASQYQTASAMPYGAYGAIGQGQLGALNTLGQYGSAGANQANQQNTDYLSYLGQGTSQQQANNQTANLQNTIQQQNLANLFGGVGGFGSAYSFLPSNYGGGFGVGSIGGGATGVPGVQLG